ncbi:MAG: AAA family ATPase [Deltaproteobacteria bacterium]|nr:AAA family ATPase [Deltaproteobacteria bacterium]
MAARPSSPWRRGRLLSFRSSPHGGAGERSPPGRSGGRGGAQLATARILAGGNHLITARPGEGKTTLIRRLASRLADLAPCGFYTEELRREGVRVGFRLVGLDGTEALLAHVELPGPRRVGRYGVDVKAFDAFLAGLATSGSPVLLVDEIGKMECLSAAFRGLVPRWLDGPAHVVATVAQRGEGLISDVKRRRDCELHELRRRGFDDLLELLESAIRRGVGG